MLVTRSKPISEQVNVILRRRIGNAVYAPGQRLPSESELANEFGVSRATIRTVLAKLAVEGLILRKQGDGTYVNKRIEEVNTHLGGLWDFAHLIVRSGFKVTIRSLEIRTVKASKEDALALALDVGEELLWMRRLFLADEKPVILANNLVPLSFLATSIDEVDGQLQIHKILRRYFHQEIAFVTTEIYSSFADDEADILGLTGRTPLLRLATRFYSKENQPIIIGDNYLNDQILKPRLVQAWS
jgi:DNA-binding GntR family transcriptional regulator